MVYGKVCFLFSIDAVKYELPDDLNTSGLRTITIMHVVSINVLHKASGLRSPSVLIVPVLRALYALYADSSAYSEPRFSSK